LRDILAIFLSCHLIVAIDNGLGVSPPMGWRSWNCYGNDVYDSRMRTVIDAMANKSRTVDGVPTSLVDVGYVTCGLDDNWQACGTGIDNSFHDAQGIPLINLNRFPDMKGMCDYAHSNGAKMGWYHNNCDCSENQKWDASYVEAHYNGDVNAIVGYGFDEVKLDGCGEFLNLTNWANLLNATGRPVLIENCHWGGDLPTLDWCPFNFFRTSGDISASWGSWFNNLQTAIKFLDYDNPLSRPGCWAYPDMLEVGNLPDYNQDRAHFGAWVVISAPLILGFDLTDQTKLTQVWDIITNREAISISQTWAGHPGMLVKSWNPSDSPTQTYLWAVSCNAGDATQVGFSYDSTNQAVRTLGGLCMDYSTPGQLIAKKCDGSSNQQIKYYNGSTNELKANNGDCVDINNFQGPVTELWSCNGGCNQQYIFNQDGTVSDTCSPKMCLAARNDSPAGGNLLQLWAKPQPEGVAALVINSDNGGSPHVVDIDLSSLNVTGTVNVRDIWLRKDLGQAAGNFTTDAINGYDSRFYLFTPT